MNKLMVGLLAFLMVSAPGALGAEAPVPAQEHFPQNKLVNPGYENGAYGWTASGGATKTANTTAVGEGSFGYDWNSNGAAQTLLSTAYTVENNLKGKNGLAYCGFKVPSGTATHTMSVNDGSSDLVTAVTIPTSSSQFVRVPINFPMPSSGSVKIKITSVAADEPEIYIDSCYLGEAYNISQINQSSMVASGYFAATASCVWTRTKTALGVPATISACPGPTLETNNGPGILQTTDTDLPKVTVNNLPPGTYEVCMEGTAFIGTSGQEGALAINDGTTTSGQKGMEWATGGGHWSTCGVFTYTAAANVSWQLFVSSAANQISVVNNGTNQNTYFTVKRFPTVAQTAFTPEVYNWRVDASIAGGSWDLGSSDQTAYVGMTLSTMTLTNNTSTTGNVLTAQIPCSTTNPPTGTTCGAGTEDNGVSFTIPAAGDVEACVAFTHQFNVGATGFIFTTFQIVETPNAAQTISQEGKDRINSSFSTASHAGRHPMRICGTFSFTSAGQKTLRLMYEQDVNATVSSNLVVADADVTEGQTDVHWTVRPITQAIPAPVLVNSVTSTSAGSDHLERVAVGTKCTASPCTMDINTPGITSVTRTGTGAYSINFTAGTFSTTPTCIVSGYIRGTANGWCHPNSEGSTSVQSVACYHTETAEDDAFSAICMGPR